MRIDGNGVTGWGVWFFSKFAADVIDYKLASRAESYALTVCIAALFSWNYAPLGAEPKIGLAAITASDKMITAGDVQYEPSQQKVAAFGPKVLLLVAGDFATHSEAIQIVHRHLNGRTDAAPERIAVLYGQAIQQIKRRHAEDVILAPLGLNTDTFLGQQKDMSDYFVRDITDQLQRFSGQDVEAIIIGSDGAHVHLYEVDARGSVSCIDDVGFHAIGAGAWHAKSQLMQSGYVRGIMFAEALAQVYVAKRRAEVAPGVGLQSDFHVIGRDSWWRLPEDISAELDRLYEEYTERQRDLAIKSVEKLQGFLNDRERGREGSLEDQEGHGEAGELASQAAGRNASAEGPPHLPNPEGQEEGPI